MIHIITMRQSPELYWIATCSCSWFSARYPKLAEAEQAGEEHSRAHNEANA